MIKIFDRMGERGEIERKHGKSAKKIQCYDFSSGFDVRMKTICLKDKKSLIQVYFF